MMDTTSAFPTNRDNGVNFSEPGMMLRDYFAAAALQGLLADPNVGGEPLKIATTCYRLADAMLEARQV